MRSKKSYTRHSRSAPHQWRYHFPASPSGHFICRRAAFSSSLKRHFPTQPSPISSYLGVNFLSFLNSEPLGILQLFRSQRAAFFGPDPGHFFPNLTVFPLKLKFCEFRDSIFSRINGQVFCDLAACISVILALGNCKNGPLTFSKAAASL